MSDLCHGRPMLDRVIRHAELMDRMMERVGIDATAAARLDKGNGVVESAKQMSGLLP